MPETTVPIAAELLVSHFRDCPVCTAFLDADLHGPHSPQQPCEQPEAHRSRCPRGEFYSQLLTAAYSVDAFVEAAARLDREPA